MSAAGWLLAATLSVGSGDTLLVDTFAPPALEAHPTNPDRAYVAVSSRGPGAFQFRTTAAQSLAWAGSSYALAAQNCSESAIPTPLIGGLYLEQDSGATRGWIPTSACELVIPFDYSTGAGESLHWDGGTRTAVPTRHELFGAFTRYTASGPGAALTSFNTGYTASVLRIGDRLLVATSNLYQGGASPIYNPGTVLFFDLDDSGPTLEVAPAEPFYALTTDPNPVALSALAGGRVAVINAGLFDASFPPLVTGNGSIDVLDAATGALVGSIPLGPGNPGGRGLAIDPTGSVGLTGSPTLRRLYAIDLRGIADLPVQSGVDARLQRPSCNDTSAASVGGVPCLRARALRAGSNAIALPAPPGSSGIYSYVPQVRFGATGTFAAATSYNDGGLALLAFDPRNIARPHPILASRFGAPQTLAATGPAGEIGEECCPGPMLLKGAGTAASLTGSDVLFATASPDALIVRGNLSGSLAAATGDFDADGTEDALDTCPVEPNPGGADASGDGVGDVCQCGDVSNDGFADTTDAQALRTFLANPAATLAAPQKCDVGGAPAGSCDLQDAVRLRRALGAAAPGIAHVCAPFVP